MVTVTKDNFLEVSDELIAHLPNASYVAIDEEMTGITLPGTKRPSKVHTPSQRYENMKNTAERYAIIQVGITLFERIEGKPLLNDKKEEVSPGADFLSRSYNFYIFPPAGALDVRMNTKTVSFLNEHNMDFGKWMTQGIPYCHKDIAERLLADFKERHDETRQQKFKQDRNKRRKIVLTEPADISFVSRAMAQLREWMGRPIVSNSNDESDEDSQKCHALPPCNPFLRRALYETIEREYPSLVLEKSPIEKNTILAFRLDPQEERARKERKRREGYNDLMTKVIGFYKIFEALSKANRGLLCPGDSDEKKDESREMTVVNERNNDTDDCCHQISKRRKLNDKQLAPPQNFQQPPRQRIPIVVHNGIMDILFLLSHFHSPALPDTWHEAKKLINDYFPLLYDTKFIASEYYNGAIEIPFTRSTILAELYENLYCDHCMEYGGGVEEGNDPEVSRLGFKTEVSSPHDAGYDSYMTGCVFYALGEKIMRDCEEWSLYHLADLLLEDALDVNFSVDSLLGRNKLFLCLSIYTIDLSSPCDPYCRGIHPQTTYRVSDIDTNITTRDVHEALVSVAEQGYDITWIDDTTFMIIGWARPLPSDDGVEGRSDESDDDFIERLSDRLYRALRRKFPRQTIMNLDRYILECESQNNSEVRNDPLETKWNLTTLFSGLINFVKSFGGSRKRKFEH